MSTFILPMILCVLWIQHSSAMTLREHADLLHFNTPSFDDVNEQYAVMFDAGSSGTRVKVYKYSKKNGEPLQVSNFEQLEVPKPNKVKPGLSSFANNIAGIKKYLEPLIESAKNIVPDEKQANASLRIFATAGMRLLNDDQVKAIFDEVESLLTNKDINTFSYNKGDAKVITGQDEAIYDWVTVNFLKGVFYGCPKKTFGALDMGGASHQNSFELSKGNPKYQPSTVHHDIAGKNYTIYAHSYLGGGEREARKYFLESLVRNAKPGQKTFYSSCHNYGLNREVSVDGIQYEVKGAFTKPEKCAILLKKFFFCKSCDYQNQPKLDGEFYSFSVFGYAFQGTGVVSGNDEVVPLQKIDDVILSYCSKRYDELDVNDPYSYQRCFQLNYIRALLRYGYRVGKNFKLHNALKLNGFDLNWAIGALLISNDLL